MASGTGIDEAVRGAKNFGWSWGTIEKEKEKEQRESRSDGTHHVR